MAGGVRAASFVAVAARSPGSGAPAPRSRPAQRRGAADAGRSSVRSAASRPAALVEAAVLVVAVKARPARSWRDAAASNGAWRDLDSV